MAAVFAIVGVPLVLSALGTLLASPPIDQQTVAMMQVIAGLLCILIAVVAGLMRPTAQTPVEGPRPSEPRPAAAAAPAPARDGAGLGVLIVFLAAVLIAAALWLRTSGRERDARALIPLPSFGSASGPASRPDNRTAPAVLPAGGTETRKAAGRAHAPARARAVRDDD